METLPATLYRAAAVRELDRIAIEEFHIPGATLMQRAGAAAFELLRARWPQARRVAVLCGVGNNGGDGYVVARLARVAALDVVVFQVGNVTTIRGDAAPAREAALQAGVPCNVFAGQDLSAYDVLVDAVLGTGLRGAVQGEWRVAIEALNRAQRPVLGLDIPSGLNADTGGVLGAAVRATVTITFIGLKQGLFTGDAVDYCGALTFASLDVPDELYGRVVPSARRIDADTLSRALLPRARSVHKGDLGHVLVIGGERGYIGAARMAGEAALRAGAGLVSVATRVDHAAALGMGRPELMCHGVEHAVQLRPLLQRATVVAIGPGLGQSAWARELLGAVLETTLPLVIDADALNLLAQEPITRANWILTPHPGEAARLLNVTATEIQSDRYAAARALRNKFGGVLVLKGAGTVVCANDGVTSVCTAGNPGMASGGMGDVLTGVIAAFIAQGMALHDAACAGVCAHACAADVAARTGERGLLASDVLNALRTVVNPIGAAND